MSVNVNRVIHIDSYERMLSEKSDKENKPEVSAGGGYFSCN
jgi:hypothetical protein